MSDAPQIRPAVPGDEAALALLGAATFLHTYAHMIPGPDLIRHCACQHSAETYTRWLGEAAVRIWIAETAVGAPAGYLVLVPATLPPDEADPRDLEVLRIYVLARYQHTGLGRALMARAMAAARDAGARRLVLGVHLGNTKALEFYAREGFARIADRRFRVGESCFCDAVLARPVD